tara:strand:+ start:564 stop:806 length:243 start_codon:yes stop_codon:yes gene_type:complete
MNIEEPQPLHYCQCVKPDVIRSRTLKKVCGHCGGAWHPTHSPIPNAEFKDELKAFMRQKVGRNDLCPCGSGKKFKKCCIK